MNKVVEKNNSVGNMYKVDLENTIIYNIFTKAGNYRGGKIYSNDKKLIIIYGIAKMISFDGKKDIVHYFKSGDIVDIKAGLAHIFYFEEDCEIIEYFEKGTKSEEYNRYYEMKKNYDKNGGEEK